MKTIIIFFAGILFSFAQSNVLNQEFYFINKNKTVEFKQTKDSLFITNCIGIKKCDSLPKFSYIIEKDSIIDNNTKMVIVKGQKYKHKSLKVHKKEIIFISYANGRKAIKESYKHNGKEKIQFPVLYPKSELESLKAITEISASESKEILMDFMNYIKSKDKDEFDFDDYINWEKFNDLVILKGYNPIGAEREIGLKTD